MTELKDVVLQEVGRVKIDFKALKEWRKPGSDDLPVYGIQSLYEACGICDLIRESGIDQVAPLDNLSCNFYTMQAIKKFIREIWEVYSLDIDAHEHVFWDTSKWPKGTKHYHKKLSKKVEFSLNADFVNFCPALDDELEDYVIVLSKRI